MQEGRAYFVWVANIFKIDFWNIVVQLAGNGDHFLSLRSFLRLRAQTSSSSSLNVLFDLKRCLLGSSWCSGKQAAAER